MPAKTNAEEAAYLEHRFRGGAALPQLATTYIALFTLAPGETGGGTEPSGGSYARLAMAAADWAAVVAGEPSTISNAVEKLFAQATADWGTIVGVMAMTAAVGGQGTHFTALGTSKAVNAGDNAKFNVGDLTIGES